MAGKKRYHIICAGESCGLVLVVHAEKCWPPHPYADNHETEEDQTYYRSAGGDRTFVEITLQNVMDTIESMKACGMKWLTVRDEPGFDSLEDVRSWVESRRSVTDLCVLNIDRDPPDPDQVGKTGSPSIPFVCA